MVQEDLDHLEILNYPLFYLKVCGRDPRMSSRVYFFSTLLFTIAFVFWYGGLLANFLYAELNVFYFVVNCEGLSVIFQMYGKVVATTLLRNSFNNLITIARGWKFDDCSSSLKKDIKFILNTTLAIQKIYVRSMVVGTILVMVVAIFTKQFPTGAWKIPNQDSIYYSLLIIDEVAGPFYSASTVSVDCLFLAFCMLLSLQFKVLCARLKQLKVPSRSNEKDNKNFLKKLGQCIEQHNYLLQYGKLLRDTYSPIILLEFITTGITAFVELYLVFHSDDVVHIIRGLVLFFDAMLELSFFCVAATITTTEISNVANAIYESDWNSNYVPQLGNTIATIIGRAQRDLTFTAGGLRDVNVKTMITVTQFAWSTCTLMARLHKK